MKIIYNIAGLYNAGGMERVLTNKANYLVGLGHEVVIITTDQNNRKPYFKLDDAVQLLDLGVGYDDIQGLGLVAKAVGYLRKQHMHEQKLRTVLEELRGDIAISMFDHDIAFLHRMKDGSKKVLEIHFSRFKRLQYGRKGLWGIVDRLRSNKDLRLAQRYDRFVVLTEEDKGYWGNLPNMCVIPNANSFMPVGAAELTNKVAVAVGRFDYQKGFDELVAIWAMIRPAFPDWQLHIYGEGKLEGDLRERIAELDLGDHVYLCKPTKNIEAVYLDSAIYLMTSRYEGLPMALLEAQACGLPLLSYACRCGPRDIIEQGRNGYWVEEGDRLAFVHRLKEMLENQNMRNEMGIESKKMSIRFSEDLIMRRWIGLFEEVLEIS